MLKTRTRWKLQTCTNWFGKSGVAVQHTPHLVFYHIASQPSVPKQQSLVCWLVGGSDAHNSFFSLAFMYFNVRFSMSCLQTHIHTNTQLGLRLRFYFKHLKSMPSTIHVLLNILVQAKHWDGITKQKTAAKLFLFCFFCLLWIVDAVAVGCQKTSTTLCRQRNACSLIDRHIHYLNLLFRTINERNRLKAVDLGCGARNSSTTFRNIDRFVLPSGNRPFVIQMDILT